MEFEGKITTFKKRDGSFITVINIDNISSDNNVWEAPKLEFDKKELDNFGELKWTK